MDNSSYFIKEKAIFGSYPTQESVKELEDSGVIYFINLTNSYEKKIKPYTTKYNYINYPIEDRNVPKNLVSFANFILELSKIINNIKNNKKIYIHCKGGHGRSGLVVASLICHLFNYTPDESLKYTSYCHRQRKNLKEKWKKIGAPQTYDQKKFVHTFFKPIIFYNSTNHYLSNFSNHPIQIKNLGTFCCVETSFLAFKNKDNKEYIDLLLNIKSPFDIHNILKNFKLIYDQNEWEHEKINIMKKILIIKINKYPEIKSYLLKSGLSPIIHYSKYDLCFGQKRNGNGKNMLGKLLEEIRLELYKK